MKTRFLLALVTLAAAALVYAGTAKSPGKAAAKTAAQCTDCCGDDGAAQTESAKAAPGAAVPAKK